MNDPYQHTKESIKSMFDALSSQSVEAVEFWLMNCHAKVLSIDQMKLVYGSDEDRREVVRIMDAMGIRRFIQPSKGAQWIMIGS